MGSYSSETHGFRNLWRDGVSLYRLHTKDTSVKVESAIKDIRLVEERINAAFSIRMEDLDILEIGPGQFLTQLSYLALRNRVIGIDRDVIVQGFDPLGYARMLRDNGPYRTAKTLFRKAIGIDRRYASQLKTQLGVKRLARPLVRSMDVRRTSFPPSSFDLVYCRSVLHHLPDPGSAVDEIVRVLRPSGIAYVSIHPYTSETGCLDPRIYTERGREVQGWPHLRNDLKSTLQKPNAQLNQLTLEEWRKVFGSKMTGCRYVGVTSSDSTVEAARQLKAQGELADYSLEDLITGEFVAMWQKPAR